MASAVELFQYLSAGKKINPLGEGRVHCSSTELSTVRVDKVNDQYPIINIQCKFKSTIFAFALALAIGY